MIYELSSLEWELSPHKIQNTISNIAVKKTTNAKQNKEPQTLKNQREYYNLIEKFKKLFIKEFHRIRASINDHKIEDKEDVFIRYIATNYVGLTKLCMKQQPIKPPNPKENNPDTDLLTQQDTLEQINNNLQTLLVIPLREFIETTFKKELIINHLFDSPVETFLKAIKSNCVSVSRQTDQVSEDYRAIYSPISNCLFTLEYNGYRLESLYGKSLEKKYEAFQNFIEDYLESPATVLEKLKYLSKLKIKITDLNDLFCEEGTKKQKNYRPFRSHRIDAVGNLKHKLFRHNILPDLDEFYKELMQLTELQSIYIARATKFVVAQIQFLEEYKSTVETIFQQKKDFLETPSTTRPDSYGKLQWRGNINQLVAFFYDAYSQVFVDGEPILKATKQQLVLFLTQNFTQKDGEQINPSTIKTIFSPSKELKRPPLTRRITFPKF